MAFVIEARRKGDNFRIQESQLPELAALGLTRELLGELGLEIVPDAEATADSTLICLGATPLLVADNLVGSCVGCNQPIQFRPYAAKVGRKLCFNCAGRELIAAGLAVEHRQN